MKKRELIFTAHIPKKAPFPKVAEDGKVLSDVSPYYKYICANKNCGCCGWVHNWVDKQDDHKCTICGKTMIRVANPKQVDKEDYS